MSFQQRITEPRISDPTLFICHLTKINPDEYRRYLVGYVDVIKGRLDSGNN